MTLGAHVDTHVGVQCEAQPGLAVALPSLGRLGQDDVGSRHSQLKEATKCSATALVPCSLS